MADRSSRAVAIIAIIVIVILIGGLFYYLSGESMPEASITPAVDVTSPPPIHAVPEAGGETAGTTINQ